MINHFYKWYHPTEAYKGKERWSAQKKNPFIFSFDDATQGKRKALHTAKRIHLEYCIGAGRKSDISAALTEEDK